MTTEEQVEVVNQAEAVMSETLMVRMVGFGEMEMNYAGISSGLESGYFEEVDGPEDKLSYQFTEEGARAWWRDICVKA